MRNLLVLAVTVTLVAMLAQAQPSNRHAAAPPSSAFKLTMLKKLDNMRAQEPEQSLSGYHKTINKNKNKLTVKVPTRFMSKNLGYTEQDDAVNAYGSTKAMSGEYNAKAYKESKKSGYLEERYSDESMMPKFPEFKFPEIEMPKIKIPLTRNNIDIYIRNANTNTNENKHLIKSKASAYNKQANDNQNANYKANKVQTNVYSKPEPYQAAYPQDGYYYYHH